MWLRKHKFQFSFGVVVGVDGDRQKHLTFTYWTGRLDQDGAVVQMEDSMGVVASFHFRYRSFIKLRSLPRHRYPRIKAKLKII